MSKKVAVLVVNPVNGFGLFEYLEAFYENGIPFKTFAVSDTTDVKTNSGVALKTDDLVSNLKNNVDQYDVLVFACGDAMRKFSENAAQQYNQDMLAVIKDFDDKGKLIVGHCAAALLFDKLNVGKGKEVALHPFIKSVVQNCIGTDKKTVIDGNLMTAQTEHTIHELIPELLKRIK